MQKNIGAAIPTYFSHSYRREDHDLNARFWRLFEKKGFFFSVDPPSNISIHTHLERMIHQSSCYVAIINRRDDAPGTPLCSRFILYELALALQARRPRLLLIDRTVQGRPLDRLSEKEVHPFDPKRPEAGESELIKKIDALRESALPVTDFATKKRGPIGLILPKDRGDKCYGGVTTQKQIELAAGRHGFLCKPILVPHESNSDLALDLEECEAVILGVRADKLPPWVFAYVHGRLIPSIKLVRVAKNELPHEVRLPPLVKGLQMDEREPAVESLIYWRAPDDLVYQLSECFEKLDEEPTELRREEEGVRYFMSIGRRPARVFISNAGAVNPLAEKLSNELRLYNIERFQYKDEKAIATGSQWQKKIRHELEICQVFVALLSKDYAKSEWCMKELHTARRRVGSGLKILPYRVDDSNVSYMKSLQVTDLHRLKHPVTRIVEDIHDHLTKEDDGEWYARNPIMLGGSREVVTDALRHIPSDAWKRLVDELNGAGIAVSIGASRTKLRSRQIADQLLLEVQRATTAADTQAPLALLVDRLRHYAPAQYHDALENLYMRL